MIVKSSYKVEFHNPWLFYAWATTVTLIGMFCGFIIGRF